MHPASAFRVAGRAPLLALLAAQPFCTLSTLGGGRPAVAHAPVVIRGEGAALEFHLSRGNRLAGLADATPAVLTALAGDAYVSPDWYESADQVPTWNYRLVEAEGLLTRLDEAELVALLDDLSAQEEARLAPKQPWTRHKMSPGRFEAMARGVVGFRLMVERLEGVDKLSQNKNAADRAGVVKGLGNHPLGALIPKD
jgi:transcriptional regulator